VGGLIEASVEDGTGARVGTGEGGTVCGTGFGRSVGGGIDTGARVGTGEGANVEIEIGWTGICISVGEGTGEIVGRRDSCIVGIFRGAG
jgi:hypothetical protein